MSTIITTTTTTHNNNNNNNKNRNNNDHQNSPTQRLASFYLRPPPICVLDTPTSIFANKQHDNREKN
jgi:hypothetical protein